MAHGTIIGYGMGHDGTIDCLTGCFLQLERCSSRSTCLLTAVMRSPFSLVLLEMEMEMEMDGSQANRWSSHGGRHGCSSANSPTETRTASTPRSQKQQQRRLSPREAIASPLSSSSTPVLSRSCLRPSVQCMFDVP